MTAEKTTSLRLDSTGNIVEILNDSLGLTTSVDIGKPFARMAASGSLAKALSFVAEIDKSGSAFGWEFSVTLDGRPQNIHFNGGKFDGQMIVVAADNGPTAIHFFEEMMLINNEQTNALREAYGVIKRDNDLYEEISRLNNDLVGIQRELAKKNAALIQLNQEKNRFLGIAAHDLRNPLHAILMLSEFLLDEVADGEQKEFLEEIRSNSTFMARLIDDLLDVAKIESGQVALDYTTCDINDLINANVKRQRLVAARKKIEVSFTDKPLPPVQIDIFKIEQVLNNLIGNAIKFTTPGGQIEVRVHEKGDYFQIEIQDWGTGIPPEIQSKLFTVYGKGQAGTAGEKSTGLGLVIVKQIIQAHKGEIHLESTPGVGTIFFVTLPFAPKP